MVQHRSNKGKIIDFESLLAAQGDEPAVGNMNVNARGDVIGRGGQIVQKAEDRTRAYYKDNPKSSTASKTSLKGPMPDDSSVNTSSNMTPEVKTATAVKTEQNQSVMNPAPVQPDPDPVPQPEEFDAPDVEPLGYKEVEMPNGDIQMVPYYNEEDAK